MRVGTEMMGSPIMTPLLFPVTVSTYEGVGHAPDPEKITFWSWSHPHPMEEEWGSTLWGQA